MTIYRTLIRPLLAGAIALALVGAILWAVSFAGEYGPLIVVASGAAVGVWGFGVLIIALADDWR
jgi:hypothetical protein